MEHFLIDYYILPLKEAYRQQYKSQKD